MEQCENQLLRVSVFLSLRQRSFASGHLAAIDSRCCIFHLIGELAVVHQEIPDEQHSASAGCFDFCAISQMVLHVCHVVWMLSLKSKASKMVCSDSRVLCLTSFVKYDPMIAKSCVNWVNIFPSSSYNYDSFVELDSVCSLCLAIAVYFVQSSLLISSWICQISNN